MGYQDAPEGWWQDFVLAIPARTAKVGVTLADGAPHVSPVWVAVDGTGDAAEILFTTHESSVKGRALRRDPRISLCLDDERPPFAFLTVIGTVTISEDPADLLTWATRIGGRYMGADRAEEYGRRNGVPGELLIRVRPERVIAKIDVAG